DDTTFEYLSRTPHAPKGAAWERALRSWRALPSDPAAAFDLSADLDAGTLEPMITYGTHPGMSIPISGAIPDPSAVPDGSARAALDKALRYMGLRPGKPLLGQQVDVVFIGSCTNGRLSDLRVAADALRGRKLARNVRALVVPGSQQVKRQAEAEGLDRVFREAGAEWREPGCSMCIAMNGDRLEPGQYAVSTSNRNFEGRQGPGGRTFLASPLTAAAAALAGRIADPRQLARQPMEPVRTLESKTVVLPNQNIDTDQIIPARFLKGTDRRGLGAGLFAAWRYDEAGKLRAEFPLNRPEAKGAQILVAGENFGCGSSREHAAWALLEHGFRAVVGCSIADIFRRNVGINELLAARV